MAKLQASTVLRYSLAPLCIGLAVLLHVSFAGLYLHPTGLFLAGIVAAAWFGGAGPGFVAALLATLVLPQYVPRLYPLLGDFFDLPRFLPFALTGLAVGWGTTTRKRVQAALRESEQELRRTRSELEARVIARTAALRLSEERYALGMQASEEGHFDSILDSGEMFVSERLREILGVPTGPQLVSRAEFMQRVPFYCEDDRRLYMETITAAQAPGGGDCYQFEFRIAPRPGEVRWIAKRGKISRDREGRAERCTGVVTDITERKHTEDELRARQEMLDLAQKSARATAFEWRVGAGDGENRWSTDLEVMYGLEPGTYDGTFDTWRKLIHPDDWPAVKEAIRHAQRTGDVACEYRVVHRDGSAHWLEARGRMFFDRDGNPARMVGFMQDVSQRRRAEEELKRMEGQLRRAQRLEAMGTLAGGIAHDFNNILGAVLGYGEMALRGAPPDSRLRRDLDSIVTAGERGRALVDRILAFSRSGVGEQVPVDVERVVREAIGHLCANVPPGVRIEIDLAAGRAAMQGDPTQVHQVLMNLASNALQAMPDGGTLRVSLACETIATARLVSIGALNPGEFIVLRVADSGCGIAPEIVDRIFDPFFTTKDVGVGTGLGLSLVHGIVTQVGGAIEVSTRVGEGSVFTVYLPRSGTAPVEVHGDEPALQRGNRERVLVVDDEEPLVTLATRTLRELGYEASGFTSSIAALDAFRADPQRFDAVITDERMPGMSGSMLIREIREIRNAIPVVLMSGFPAAALAVHGEEVGADDILRKPLTARDLATSLARVLQTAGRSIASVA